MFRGINTVSLDDKNRLSIPIKYRETLYLPNNNGQLIVTIDPEERCLLMYPLIFWLDIEKKIESLPSFNYAARRIQRLLIGHAAEMIIDNQGRILLPQELIEYASLKKRGVLVGQGKKMEIWDLDKWTNKRETWIEEGSLKSHDLPEDLQNFSL
jgi:MraZ protein